MALRLTFVFLLACIPNTLAQALPLGVQRLTIPLSDLESVLVAPNVNSAIDQLVQRKARYYTFEIQGLFRLYRNWDGFDRADAAALESYLGQIKELEDTLGKFVDLQTLGAFATTNNLPKPVINLLDQRIREAKAQLQTLLCNKKWFAPQQRISPKIRSMLEDMESWEWPQSDDDKQFVGKQIGKYIKKSIEKEYDLSNLEEGLHELRRDLRWIGIYIRALHGGILIANKSTHDLRLDAFLRNTRALELYRTYNEPRNQIPVDQPILISKPLIVALSWFIFHLGELKDHGELHEKLVEAFVSSSASTSTRQADAVVTNLLRNHPAHVHFEKPTREAYGFMADTKLLNKIKDEVQK